MHEKVYIITKRHGDIDALYLGVAGSLYEATETLRISYAKRGECVIVADGVGRWNVDAPTGEKLNIIEQTPIITHL